MQTHYDTPEQFASDVIQAAKGQWVNGTFNVNGTLVGIKAYNKWVQQIHANTLRDSGEFKTQKSMRDFIIAHIGH